MYWLTCTIQRVQIIQYHPPVSDYVAYWVTGSRLYSNNITKRAGNSCLFRSTNY